MTPLTIKTCSTCGSKRIRRVKRNAPTNPFECPETVSLVFDVHPVITVEEAVRGELEVISWRDGLKRK
jgi:hypothetical protein